ncbi:MAG: TRAP transporter small permease subunit [Hyphomicrobiales bacterium]|nr:TRAP transporter small permease subunit [Hyphomicrobiales bacterium]
MDATIHWVRRSLFRIGQVEMILAAAILFGIVAMITVQVLLTAGLGNPITWEQEAGAYGLVWLTFIGASIALKQMRHVTIVSFVGMLPHRLRHVIRAIVFALVLWTLYALVRELTPIMEIEARATTVALPIDLPRSYFFSVPLMVSCLMMALTALLFLLEAILGVFSKDEASGYLRPIGSDAQ